MSSLNLIEIISNLHGLKKSSVELKRIKDATSSDDFAALLAKFEKEVDKLNACLADAFDKDPEIMQLLFELKSAVIALRAENVERVS